ncbi:chymotrypsin-like protease CTRL-1 [Muntiacus reevesi]|uniref:chymotrypsin-like protease CTRL-1 n=1 Tax=Muntiacus reevesi TaxID=9886 RepID=UPI003306F2C9
MLLLRLTLSLVLLGSSWGCGVPAIKPALHFSQRTVNGKNAVPGSWPWEVSLQDSKGFCICSGSLIVQSWVVTAAHCNASPGCHFVILGEYDRASRAQPLQGVHLVVSAPSWNPTTMNNDLTLLTLTSPAQYTMCISPVCLASSNEALPEGLTWPAGCLSGVGSVTWAHLWWLVLPLVTVRWCQQYWGSCITSSMICAGASLCQGDSGGLLVCQKGNTWVLTDTVSWSTSDCSVPTPATSTQVSRVST